VQSENKIGVGPFRYDCVYVYVVDVFFGVINCTLQPFWQFIYTVYQLNLAKLIFGNSLKKCNWQKINLVIC